MTVRPRTNLVPALALTIGLLCVVLAGGCSHDDPVRPAPTPDLPPEGFVTVPAGSFLMGSPEDELGRGEVEHLHPVTISRGFHLQATEVTNAQYLEMAQWAMDAGLLHITSRVASTTGDTIYVLRDTGNGENFFLSMINGCEIDFDRRTERLLLYDVGFGLNPDHPVKYVTWWGAAAYCNWLSLREGLEPAYDQTTWEVDLENARGYRLPTEAEWEYAARGGSKTSYAGSHIATIECNADSLQYQGWYCFNSDGWTRPVGGLAPNAFGLYDMHGNVWELCNDWYAQDYYKASPDLDPAGPETGEFLRSSRGGSWTWGAQFARSAQRGAHFMGQVGPQEGFRPLKPLRR
ncbi:SUMF1/EgtB/PvdO family nonheme iron enzyme [bacterium]|nr:SUMF1/EgtB/PvdO family nonheme iron enzyme [bacterium]